MSTATATDSSAEASGPAPVATDHIARFEDAQRRALELLSAGRASLSTGMSELDVRDWYEAEASAHGFTGWFERPLIRFNSPATFRYEMSAKRLLDSNTMVEVLLQPADDQAYGNAGATWVHGGGGEPAILDAARELCRATTGFAGRFKCVGEIFVFAQAWANNRSLHMGEEQTAVGHLCQGPEGLLSTGWPTSARVASYLRRNQVEWYNYRRMHGVYTIRPRIFSGEYSAMFGEMVYVEGDDKRILARKDIDAVGWLPS